MSKQLAISSSFAIFAMSALALLGPDRGAARDQFAATAPIQAASPHSDTGTGFTPPRLDIGISN